MPDETHVDTQVNVTNGGLHGLILRYAQTSIVTFFLLVSIWLMQQFIVQGRADRLDDRALFRESVHDIQHEADRRAGEVKGALDANTAVMRDLIAEMKAARREGHLPSAVPPKAAELRPPGGP